MKHLNSFIVHCSCNDPWLESKMYQLTLCQQHQLIDGQYPIISVKNINDINLYLNDAKWLFIETAGDYIVDRDHVWKLLHSIPETVGLIGHILWDPSEINPHLHHQCIIINTQALKGNPIDFHSRKKIGKSFVRSERSMHGDYCPAWIQLNDTVIDRDPGFGTDLMATILENGYEVINFDDEWRSAKNIDYLSHMPSRGYLNPEVETKLFSHCFKTLTVDDRLDPAQIDAITVIKNEMKYNILNALHWDHYPIGNHANLIISPANGFMGECIALKNNAKKIIFYDINPNNIDFKKRLYTNWNGKDYEDYYTEFANERGLIIDPFSPQAKENAKYHINEVNSVIESWSMFKNMEVEFIHADVITIIDDILNKFVNQTIFHTSTILNYYLWSNLAHDLDVIHAARKQIEEKTKSTNSIWYETF